MDEPSPPVRGNRSALWLAYLLMLVGGLALLAGIRAWGERAHPVPAGQAESATIRAESTADNRTPLAQVLTALVAVLIAGQFLGWLLTLVQQPPVIGDILAGIALGPSLLGALVPGASQWLLPEAIAPQLGTIAHLGVVFYMFVVGLELDLGQVRATGRQTMAIAHAGIVAPMVLGTAAAVPLYGRFCPPGVPFTPFALFVGISLSITAFPVLARLLAERGWNHEPWGTTALAAAATGDVTAWCLLAVVVGIARAHMDEALLTIAATIAYIGAMFLVVRPLLVRWRPVLASDVVSRSVVAWIFAALLVSALATEWIGIHAVFGAFLLGAIIPHESRLARELMVRLEDLVGVLLLPAFFALTGMRTRIGLVTGLDEWLWTALIVALATLGKVGGSLAAARLGGFPWRESTILGVLMNTRGLMELIVLQVGLELGVISPKLFAMLVIMALLTTLATAPIVALIERRSAKR